MFKADARLIRRERFSCIQFDQCVIPSFLPHIDDAQIDMGRTRLWIQHDYAAKVFLGERKVAVLHSFLAFAENSCRVGSRGDRVLFETSLKVPSRTAKTAHIPATSKGGAASDLCLGYSMAYAVLSSYRRKSFCVRALPMHGCMKSRETAKLSLDNILKRFNISEY